MSCAGGKKGEKRRGKKGIRDQVPFFVFSSFAMKFACVDCVTWLVLTMVLHGCAGVTVPLCTTVKGFAGEVNNDFDLTIPVQPRVGEAIVLVLRPIPYVPGLSWISARLNATYKILGSDTFALSDSFGIVQIADQIEADTTIRIRVNNMRQDGSTPFLFYSYHTGYRSCSLEISPQASFTGVIPTHIFNTNTIATLYLKAIPPTGTTGYVISSVGSVSITASLSAHEDGMPVANGARQPVDSTAMVLYFTVRPTQDVSSTQMIHLTLQWLKSSGNSPLPLPPPSPPQAGPLGGGAGPLAPQQPPASGSTPTGKAVAESSSGVMSVVIVLILVYFTSRSIYNYRVKRITTFPDFVPHHEAFSACAGCCASVATQVKAKGRQVYSGRGGYSDVNQADGYDGS